MLQSMSNSMLVAIILMMASCANSSEIETIRIGKMIPTQNSEYYRWELKLPSIEKDKNKRIIVSCNELIDYLKVSVDFEVFEITKKAYTKTESEIKKQKGWQREDFAAFNEYWANDAEEKYPGEGGFYWEFKSTVIKRWEQSAVEIDKIPCDPSNISATSSMSDKFDAMMIYVARGR